MKNGKNCKTIQLAFLKILKKTLWGHQIHKKPKFPMNALSSLAAHCENRKLCTSMTKLIWLSLYVGEHRIGNSNLTPDPQGARGPPGGGVKIQVSPNQKTLLTKVVRHDKGMVKIKSAPPMELGKQFPSKH